MNKTIKQVIVIDFTKKEAKLIMGILAAELELFARGGMDLYLEDELCSITKVLNCLCHNMLQLYLERIDLATLGDILLSEFDDGPMSFSRKEEKILRNIILRLNLRKDGSK